MSLISVITVSFNSLEGLKRTNESLGVPPLVQLETILIDGNSHDGTPQFAVSGESKYGRFVCEKDRGIYDAMNKGIRMATGRYLLFLNCGDTLTPDLDWKALVECLEREEAIWVGDLKVQGGGLATIGSGHFRPRTFVRHAIPHQASFIPRSFFEQAGFYDESYRIGADQEWFLRALVKKMPCRSLGFVIAEYQGGGVSDRADNQAVVGLERRRMLVRHLGLFRAGSIWVSVEWGEWLLRFRRNLGDLVRRLGWRR